jgi:hypothetical protein
MQDVLAITARAFLKICDILEPLEPAWHSAAPPLAGTETCAACGNAKSDNIHLPGEPPLHDFRSAPPLTAEQAAREIRVLNGSSHGAWWYPAWEREAVKIIQRAIEAATAPLSQLLPATYYADRDLAFRIEQMVGSWNRAVKANADAATELDRLDDLHEKAQEENARLRQEREDSDLAFKHAEEVNAKLETDAKRLRENCEQLQVQLAGCGVAACGGTAEPSIAVKGMYGWSPAYQDTLDLRLKYDRLREQLAERERLIDIIDHLTGDDFCEELDCEVNLPGKTPTEFQKQVQAKLSQVFRLAHAFNPRNSCYSVHQVWRDELKKLAEAGKVGK